MRSRFIFLIIFAVLLQACGSAHVRPGVSSGQMQEYKSAYIAEVIVNSKEQNGDSLEMNKKMQDYARSRIGNIIDKKRYSLVDESTSRNSQALVFKLRISVVYGSRAARYFAGFGAGKGAVNSQLEVVDSVSNKVIYSSSADSALSIGAFGGSMESVLKENIDKLLATYPKG